MNRIELKALARKLEELASNIEDRSESAKNARHYLEGAANDIRSANVWLRQMGKTEEEAI